MVHLLLVLVWLLACSGTNNDIVSAASASTSNRHPLLLPNGLATASATRTTVPLWVRPREWRLLDTAVSAGDMPADAVVAKDGSGDYTTIKEALEAADQLGNGWYIIHIKSGTYLEKVEVHRKNVLLVGDGVGRTIISGSRSYGNTNNCTPCTATLSAQGHGFMARDLTIENTAGPDKGQAVALFSNSNCSVFLRCEVRGFQDTLLAENHLQFYRDCIISGTVDFVFGEAAAAVFQNCLLLARRPANGAHNIITAQGRSDPGSRSGFIFQGCNVSTHEDLADVETYLGRPWRRYSRVVFMQTYMSGIVHPSGWVAWKKNDDSSADTRATALTVFYAEYNNTGPGASVAGRVKWPGFHVFKRANQARKFTVDAFIDGSQWLPQTNVSYNPGL
ncbi:hypothetical protein GUJ93_ZPchr0008g13408 [Zizania palustris]|uniref:Pectinesterase n=1 Tax=Zizania palustris TaxID=103762 RepID=A0A8J5RC21_ZIZPA|nr:hypothetical protein GUJ93_ZPchr0008g11947 [Zizania palustris]KAG8046767.1 hypothetical protein GUJ93_ZPchr0008g13408 [Zizania palustris]